MKIAIDAMGGDHAPEAAVEGAIQAAGTWPDLEIILVGDRSRIESLVNASLPNLRIFHADDVIKPDDEPVRAVRRKKQASMVVAGSMVKERQVDAMVSAGNTGALMTTGLLIVGRMQGVERPALAPMLPTMDGTGVLALDLGANMDASADHLLKYAIMGSVYRSRIHAISKPRVGLLNVGTEEMKGNELTKMAFPLLREAPIHFIGNVEARDVLNGHCDVLVCDGFAGNIMLKALEGSAETIFTVLKQEFRRSLMTKLAAAILKPGLLGLKRKMDYTEYGGAPLLGIDGLIFKSHGASDAKAFMNAIRVARDAGNHNLIHAMSIEIKGK